MRKFSVLHLSDLHITKYHESYPLVFKKLLKSITEETKNINSLIVVVTGDIIDKSEYEKYSDVAVEFFNDLVRKLNGKIIKMYFTPGNHDKQRNDCNSVLRGYFDGKEYDDYDKTFENKDWKNLFSHSFDEYLNLLRRIQEETKIMVTSSLYYCDVIEIDGCIIRINSLNSSLTSLDDNDKGSLHIGKFQMESIVQEFEEIKKEKNISNDDIDITLTIMHHPIFWLHKDEYDMVLNNISSLDSLSTDVLLRGHTHDRSLENNYSLYSSFSTLVTGIGSENNNNEHPQRYSIYTFMCDLNMIEIVMKSSSEKGFIPDYSAYVNETDESRKKIHFPIKVHDYFSGNHLQLPLVDGDFQPVFPTKNILETITDVSDELLLFKEELDKSLFLFKQDFISNIKIDIEPNSKYYEYLPSIEKYIMDSGNDESFDENTVEVILEYLKTKDQRIGDSIKGLLYDICVIFAKNFFENKLNNGEKIRIQFRILNKKNNNHEGLTWFSLEGNNIDVKDNISPVKWGNGLIKTSFEINKPMIYTFNDERITDRVSNTEWVEYFTYSPNILCNTYRSRKNNLFPILTFGINSNFKRSTLVFEVLSFLSLKPVIDDLLQSINESFNYSFEKLANTKQVERK